MKKVILFFGILLGIFSSLVAQIQGIVIASYYDTLYMNSLRGETVQLSNRFLEEIKPFNILSYEQAFPYSKNTFLRSGIIFYCQEHPAEFADFLKSSATSLFSNVEYELAQREDALDYAPTDYFWNKTKILFIYAPDTMYHLWHLRKIEAHRAGILPKETRI